jgi:hypothetical protein
MTDTEAPGEAPEREEIRGGGGCGCSACNCAQCERDESRGGGCGCSASDCTQCERDERRGDGCSCVACNCTQSVRDERRGDGCSCVACNCTQSVEQQCASTETVGFGPCARDWGLRLAEHALAASRRCELTKSWVRLLPVSATVPMRGGFGLLTVFVLVTPTRLEPLLGLVFCPGCSGLLHPPGHS